MRKKLFYYISAAILVLGLPMLFYVYKSKYSILEIDADNYKQALKEDNKSLFTLNLEDVIPDKFPIYMCYDALTSKNFNGNGLDISNTKKGKSSSVQIYSYQSNLNYWVIFSDNVLVSAFIFKNGIMNLSSPETPHIRKMIDKLIYNYGFTLKKSKLKDGGDIIIKEFENSFIIGSFSSIDEYPLTSSITFRSYTKNKYSFKWLF